MTFEAEAYLNRIGYKGPREASPEALAALQEHHLLSVPYENLDILQGTPLSLEIDALYDKIVNRGRGGYCFELNAMFGHLLRQLGYEVTDLFARFWRDEPNPPPKRRHHVLKVACGEGQYLCDVGVGGGVPLRPLLLAEGLEQRDGQEVYRLTKEPLFGWMLEEKKGGAWSRLYSFTEEPQLKNDFLMASYWCEHSPDSIFTKSPMVAIRTPEGRRTVAGEEFRTFTPEGVEVFRPANEEERRDALKKFFGIIL
ncbi:arylamine N-acetyltransferase [Paenibacillus aurantius]|uniref:Arylamine N-acetyltransferase n=1 Tax=Paenibacillus aurantius TaxID=2918900 RepID=A0AA96LB03_9BACL|nr:arylamine N-acetyltransferase [Paenibacillus aurantius]WNQ09050.1 arylamine N-acetyltransferase [Paenibacillus aurantius]